MGGRLGVRFLVEDFLLGHRAGEPGDGRMMGAARASNRKENRSLPISTPLTLGYNHALWE